MHRNVLAICVAMMLLSAGVVQAQPDKSKRDELRKAGILVRDAFDANGRWGVAIDCTTAEPGRVAKLLGRLCFYFDPTQAIPFQSR